MPALATRIGSRRPGAALLAAVLVAACGGIPWVAEPPALRYGVPDPNPVAYAFTDTTLVSVGTPVLGALELVSAHAGRAELQFRRNGGGGLEVVLWLTEYSGTVENPGQGAVSAGVGDIRGGYVLTLDPVGRTVILETPALEPAARRLIDHEPLVDRFFVPLPGGPVAAGAAWVDTVTASHESGGTRSVRRSIVTSTVAGDTALAGRRLLLIRTEVQEEVALEGVAGGVAVRRRLAGTTHGRVLWDPERRLLVHRTEEGELSGTLDMPAVGVTGLPARATVRRTVSLGTSPRP